MWLIYLVDTGRMSPGVALGISITIVVMWLVAMIWVFK